MIINTDGEYPLSVEIEDDTFAITKEFLFNGKPMFHGTMELWEDKRLSATEKFTFVILKNLSENNKVTIGTHALSKLCKTSRMTTIKSIKALVEHGFVEKDSTQRTNTYIMKK